MNPEGVGLGLFNCSKYLKLFRTVDNSFKVESKENLGTQFQFLIDQSMDEYCREHKSIDFSISSENSDNGRLTHNNFIQGNKSSNRTIMADNSIIRMTENSR